MHVRYKNNIVISMKYVKVVTIRYILSDFM